MSENRSSHNNYQKETFAGEAHEFCKPIPDEVEERLERIVAMAALSRGERVLDVGTGTGVLIPHIRQCRIDEVVGCDLSPAMLAKAQKQHDGVTFWLGDVIDLPESLGRFDVVFFNAMFGNVWDQRATLQKVTGMLRTGGRICISHPLGSRFVAELNRSNPRRTPHLLPNKQRLHVLLRGIPVKVLHYYDEKDFYLLVLRRS